MLVLNKVNLSIRRLVKCLALYRARRRSRQALLGLSDELLRDIGITRAQAYAEGNKAFWQSGTQAKRSSEKYSKTQSFFALKKRITR
ncbi:DUF1127 domain-containing protein [Agarivorans sp. 1_MG-2023]|uniref:DUF1127 domain-containing protein n=1 Tax=Agarivorans sp. 1_MG-2023 TaxID=3062634 RepID=UPI0026E3DD03|nr:DUF1127 domain-containing protein [Agarivorans sp. 1_MG-2023]MDO6762580.1 DUF1127 domain-containing protein [Agarivorans sp. 1_MG-2023]